MADKEVVIKVKGDAVVKIISASSGSWKVEKKE